VFAASPGSTGRVTAGAAYYGAMDMSSNAWERVVSIGHAQGRAFTGAHGNGIVSINGNANVPFWPGATAGEITSSLGSGCRGGKFSMNKSYLTISSRFAAATSNDAREAGFSMRGVRTL